MLFGLSIVASILVGLTGADELDALAADAEVVALAHASSDDTTLTAEDFHSIFRGTTSRWSSGERVTLVLPPTGSESMTHLCDELNVDERLYRRYLRELALRGEIRRPVEASTEDQVIGLLVSTPGSIAPIGSTGLSNAEAVPAPIRSVSLQGTP
jgi:hypothetical protein